uniref:histone H1-like n=1 Tax=Pristiophorus japonicus TaxID=55135 RepID=UPI00398ED52A
RRNGSSCRRRSNQGSQQEEGGGSPLQASRSQVGRPDPQGCGRWQGSQGMSLAAINKVLAAKGVDVEKRGFQIRSSIRRKVMNGSLKPFKGTGTSCSFKIAKTDPQGKVGKKVNKPAAKQSPAKKAATKKTSSKEGANGKKDSERTGWEEDGDEEAQQPQESEGGQKGGEPESEGQAQISKGQAQISKGQESCAQKSKEMSTSTCCRLAHSRIQEYVLRDALKIGTVAAKARWEDPQFKALPPR